MNTSMNKACIPGAITDRNLDTENQSISYLTAYYSGSAFGGMENHSNFLINSFNTYFDKQFNQRVKNQSPAKESQL